ncbi:hypothetical protein L6452_13429 [Arctium lappa]|uniref:Uncharacterized protein n=1 Tax=Arctium lappa TaxID=4217 RepID=A0ACB9CIG9_ARCLA|nr:hypothetical protein L6452_13429 [Arctium lappa]
MADHRGGMKLGNSGEDNNREQIEATITYPRKIRVILFDPDATDSSSDEGGETQRSSPRRIVHEIVVGVRAGDESLKRRDSVDETQTERKKFRGIRLRKWGKWCSEIRDPFSKKRIWLGTYETAEEAMNVYNAKKQEFRERQLAQNQTKTQLNIYLNRIESKKQPSTKPSTRVSKEVNNSLNGEEMVKLGEDPTRELCKGVRRTKSGRWSAKIRDPVNKSQVLLGTFDTEEEASKAFESKKLEVGSEGIRIDSESGVPLKTLKTETLGFLTT